MQDMGENIFVKSNDRNDDEFDNLSDRASKTITKYTSIDDYARQACATWTDVRAFGQVFAFKKDKKKEQESVSVGVRGPVSICQAKSLDPLNINSMQITKSVNGEPNEKGGKTSDTMGMKHFAEFGLYVIKGSINVKMAEKTGFSTEDASLIKECLRTLFVNDASSARPDGSMVVEKLCWWEHNNKIGQYSSAKVHKLLNIKLKEGKVIPSSIDDYDISVDELDGLKKEEIAGL